VSPGSAKLTAKCSGGWGGGSTGLVPSPKRPRRTNHAKSVLLMVRCGRSRAQALPLDSISYAKCLDATLLKSNSRTNCLITRRRIARPIPT
jgi:hypothetical protein